MEAIIKHFEVKKCYDELMDIINTPKVVDSSIKNKIWCEVLNQHGCIGKECPCFTTFENWFTHDHFPINSEIDFCKYRSKITIEIRVNPKQCKYDLYKEKLLASIYLNVTRYKLDSGKKLTLKFLEQDLYGRHTFTANWSGDFFCVPENIMEINDELTDKPIEINLDIHKDNKPWYKKLYEVLSGD